MIIIMIIEEEEEEEEETQNRLCFHNLSSKKEGYQVNFSI